MFGHSLEEYSKKIDPTDEEIISEINSMIARGKKFYNLNFFFDDLGIDSIEKVNSQNTFAGVTGKLGGIDEENKMVVYRYPIEKFSQAIKELMT